MNGLASELNPSGVHRKKNSHPEARHAEIFHHRKPHAIVSKPLTVNSYIPETTKQPVGCLVLKHWTN